MRRRSFMRRLIFSYLIIAVIPLTIAMSIYFVNILRQAGNTARQRLESATELVSSQFDSLMTNMSFLSVNLVSNDNFMEAVKGLARLKEGENVRLQEQYYSEISSELCTYAIFSSMHDVTFFNDAGYLVTSHEYNSGYNYTYRLSKEEMDAISWYPDVQNNYGQAIIIPLQKNQIPKSNRESLTLVRAVRDPGKIVGYLCVEIGAEDLGYLLEMDEAMTAEMLITRADGTVLYGSDEFPAKVRDGILDKESLTEIAQEYFLSQQETSPGIIVYMVMSQNTVYAEARNSIVMMGLQALGLLLLTALVIAIFAKDLSKPLTALQEEMKETNLSNLQEQGNEGLLNAMKKFLMYIISFMRCASVWM